MPHIRWTSALELGIPEIDDQHRRLVEIANRLFEALKGGKPAEEANRALAELFAYSATHFADEEAYFARFRFPERDEHAAAHRAFMSRVSDFEERLHAGEPAGIRELLDFTEHWIKRHIAKDDRVLSRRANRGTRR